VRTLDELFADYADHHRTVLNRATHCVGIPLIALCLYGIASRVTLFETPTGLWLDLGIALIAALVATYLVWSVGLAVGFAVLSAPLYVAGTLIPVSWLVGGLVLGIALQYAGHYLFEHRAPAFHRNLVHTLIGPLWIAALLLRAVGLCRPRAAAR
jgi:uncharacterized membrane protein YGL010W